MDETIVEGGGKADTQVVTVQVPRWDIIVLELSSSGESGRALAPVG